MAEAAIQNARDSLDRCTAKEGFLRAFYDRFVESSPIVKKKFETTDFERQISVLSQSLYLMLVAAGTDDGPANRELRRIGHLHSRDDRDIAPELYELWLESLMETVRDYDELFTTELEQNWRDALKPGIQILISRY